MTRLGNLIILLGILLSSCSVDESTVKVIPIDYVLLDLNDDVVIRNPLQMIGTDSAIVIRDDMDDSLFHMIDPVKLRYVGRFGRIGHQPGEFSENTFLSRLGSSGIGIFDRRRQTLYRANVCDAGNAGYSPIVSFDNRTAALPHPIVNDRYVSTMGYCPHDEFITLLSSSGRVIGRFGSRCYRESEMILPPEQLTAAYQGTILAAPGGDKIATFINNSEIAAFYRITPDSIKLVSQFCNAHPSVKFVNDRYLGLEERAPMKFVTGACNDDYVYILYSDNCLDDGPFTAVTGNRIMVYTWTGRHVAELRTNVRVRHFTAPDNQGRMYAITQDHCAPTLIYFNVPDIS